MKPSFLIKFLNSFGFAFSGIKYALTTQLNMKIHLIASILVVLLGWYFNLSKIEWCCITFCIAMVIATELLNTSIELICDFIQPEKHKKIKHIKDISAAAVLITAIAAIVIAFIIFIPKLFC